MVMNLDINTIKYVTVSHVWGSNLCSFDSGVNGANWKVSLNYPNKLIDIRRCLRMQYLQYVWIDVLCVNQIDNDIKMHQILNMDTYYKNATCCYICLDDVSRDTLINVSHAIKVPEMITCYIDDIIKLASSSWWNRVWTWQEAILPAYPKIVSVKFVPLDVLLSPPGLHYPSVDLHELLITGNTAISILNKSKHNINNFDNLRRFKIMLHEKSSFGDNYLSLRYALSTTSSRKCSLPNDALYGIVSCITDAKILNHCHHTSYANIIKILRCNEMENGSCSTLLNIGNSLLWKKYI